MPYVTVAQVRALPNLSDPAKFTDAEITAAIDWFEVTLENFTGVAWIPRTVTDERHYLTSAGVVILDNIRPRAISAFRVHSAAATSTAYTAAELADLRVERSGVIRRVSLGYFSSGYGMVGVDYTHGYDAPPADVVAAAKVAILDKLLIDKAEGGRRDRVFAVQTQDGIVRSSTPGPDRPFGIPDVDAVANRRNHRVPATA